MKNLSDCKNQIHSCSKCGLCQAVCPIYKITGNDCTVSRGHFIMLRGLIKGKLKMSKTINKYLDLCLKCSACSNFCPSGIDVVDIISLAKAEYFKSSKKEQIISQFQKKLIFGMLLNVINTFTKLFKNKKSKHFEKKVLYFGGCQSKLDGNFHIVKILNSIGIEVITPDFGCCGIPFFVRGDFESFNEYMENFYKTVDNYGIYDIVTNCASCEKTLKSYEKWGEHREINVKNIFEYIKENNLKLELKNHKKVTFHKPCNITNFEQIEWILKNTKNLEYIEMKNYDKCCGFHGLTKFSDRKIMSKLFKEKRENIKQSGAKIVLTSCLGCKTGLTFISSFSYQVQDFVEFLAKQVNK